MQIQPPGNSAGKSQDSRYRRAAFAPSMAAPNDPDFADGSLWGLHNTGQDFGTTDMDIDAPEAWDIRTSTASVIVAVIDTGVNALHEDLKDNMWVNQGEVGFNSLGRDKRINQIDDDGNGLSAPNDDLVNATLITGNKVTVHGSNLGSTQEAGEPVLRPTWYAEGASESSVWWKWIAPGTGQTTISTYGSFIVNELIVFTGSSVDALNMIAYEHTGEHIDNYDTYEEKMDRGTRELSFNAVSGTTYYIKVNGSGWDRTAEGPITLSIDGQLGIPAAPDNFMFHRVNTAGVDFTWSDLSFDEEYFIIQRSESMDGIWNEVINTGSADVTSGNDLNADKGYYYRLRAQNSVGYSDWVHLETNKPGDIPGGYDQAWKDLAFFPGASGPDTEPLSDYNGDGRSNLEDYAYQIILNDPIAAFDKLPVAHIGFHQEVSILEYSFRRIADGTGSPITAGGYLASEVRYTVQYNHSLAGENWITGDDIFELAGDPLPNGDGTESVTVRLLAPISSEGEAQHLVRLLLEFVPSGAQ